MGLHPGIRFLLETKPKQDSNIGDNIGGIVATRLLSKMTQFLRGGFVQATLMGFDDNILEDVAVDNRSR